MKIRITCFVLVALITLSTLVDLSATNDKIATAEPITTFDPTSSVKTERNSAQARPKPEERKLREQFEREERKYYDKRITNLERNIQNMLANLYLSASKKMELDVTLALLRKAASSKDIDVKEFAYKEAFDISVRALP